MIIIFTPKELLDLIKDTHPEYHRELQAWFKIHPSDAYYIDKLNRVVVWESWMDAYHSYMGNRVCRYNSLELKEVDLTRLP